METPDDRDEMYAKLKRNRERILLLLYRYGDLRSREIRDRTGLSQGSKNHHYGVLQEWGLIEVVGETDDSGGWTERIFGLTAEGEEFVEDYLVDADDDRPDSYDMRLERAEDKIDELEATVEQQRRTIEELREDTTAEDRFETLLDRLRNEYKEEVISEAADRVGSE